MSIKHEQQIKDLEERISKLEKAIAELQKPKTLTVPKGK